MAELLARCPGLVVLGTSRAALRVRGERDRPLEPLSLPAGSDPAAVASSPAARVFLDRARDAGRSVAPTDATAAPVAAICRRLDGLPLALELAAAHARFLSPGAVRPPDSAINSPAAESPPGSRAGLRGQSDGDTRRLDGRRAPAAVGRVAPARPSSPVYGGYDQRLAEPTAAGTALRSVAVRGHPSQYVVPRSRSA